jgi:hypothetical protein
MMTTAAARPGAGLRVSLGYQVTSGGSSENAHVVDLLAVGLAAMVPTDPSYDASERRRA